MLRALSSLLLLTATACSTAPTATACAPPLAPPSNRLGLEGTPMVMAFDVPSCGIPDGVEASVLDPQGQPVPSSVLTPVTARRAQIAFTPPSGGPFHAAVRFQPNLGQVQRDVFVVSEHAWDLPMTFDAGELSSCAALETFGTQLICLESGVAVFAPVDGTLRAVQEISATLAARARDMVWVVGQGGLSRWVPGPLADGGSGLVQSPPAEIWIPQGPNLLLLPSYADVVVVTDQDLRTVRVDGDRLVVQVRAPLIGVAAQGGWRLGSTIGVVDSSSECTLDLDGGVAPRCAMLPAGGGPREIIAYGSDGVWAATRDPGGDALELVRNGVRAKLDLPAGEEPTSFALEWDVDPVIPRNGEVLTVGLVDGSIELGHYVQTGYDFSVTHRFVASGTADGTVLLFRR